MHIPIVRRNVVMTVCGILAGLLISEVALRPFSNESGKGGYFQLRQYSEGTSVARYITQDPRPLKWRLTGNRHIEDAPVILIVGDSFVAGRQVSDEKTMGSLIEKWSRAGDHPLNVRQYGLSSGSAPEYAGHADGLLKRWNPAWVVVVLSANDLGAQALTKGVRWRMRINSDDSVEAFEIQKQNKTSEKIWTKSFQTIRSYSSLLQVLHYRWQTINKSGSRSGSQEEQAAPDRKDVGKVPRASVLLLKAYYGSRLLVIHLPEIIWGTEVVATREERKLKRACEEKQIPYASCSQEFHWMRQRYIYPNGFHNTLPGEGHLNEKGHRAVAKVIWQLLNQVTRQTQHRTRDIGNENTQQYQE